MITLLNLFLSDIGMIELDLLPIDEAEDIQREQRLMSPAPKMVKAGNGTGHRYNSRGELVAIKKQRPVSVAVEVHREELINNNDPLSILESLDERAALMAAELGIDRREAMCQLRVELGLDDAPAESTSCLAEEMQLLEDDEELEWEMLPIEAELTTDAIDMVSDNDLMLNLAVGKRGMHYDGRPENDRNGRIVNPEMNHSRKNNCGKKRVILHRNRRFTAGQRLVHHQQLERVEGVLAYPPNMVDLAIDRFEAEQLVEQDEKYLDPDVNFALKEVFRRIEATA